MLIRSAPGTAVVAPHLRRRMRGIVVVVVVAASLLAARLWQLQIVRGEEHYERAMSNVVKEQRIPPVRGQILDRSGVPLAENRPAFNIYVRPGAVGEREKAHLFELLDLSPEESARASERLVAAWERGEREPILLLTDQGRDRASLLAQSRLQFPGVEVRDELYRTYPHGAHAGHVLGYMNQISREEYEERSSEGYARSDMVGRHGLERAWEDYLRGESGTEQIVVNASGHQVDDEAADALIEGSAVDSPVPGHNVVTTIDYELQAAAEEAASREAAAAIAVVDVDSGRIRALVSQPSFDPNDMTGHLSREMNRRLNSDPRRPFVDKTLAQHYPPASTFKSLTAIAQLERGGAADPAERINCSGFYALGRHRFHCMGTHGSLDMREALAHSCNSYFYQLGERAGVEGISDVALDFGFGEPTGLGLNSDISGGIPTPEFYLEEKGFVPPGEALNMAVGQGRVEVTVIQMAMAYAAIAGGGDLYAPQVVKRLEGPSGEVAREFEPELRRRVDAGEETLASVRDGLEAAVQEPIGTGYRTVRSDVVDIAGKTGTAQVRSGRGRPSVDAGWHPDRPHAWFVGYAPADDPELAFAVLIPHGGGGSRAAGPVARAIAESYFGDDAEGARSAARPGGGTGGGSGAHALASSGEGAGRSSPDGGEP